MAKQKNRPRKKAISAAIERRRQKVADGLLAGDTYRVMAKELRVSLGTIAKDTKAIFTQWREDRAWKIEEWASLQVHRLDKMLHAIWPEVLAGELPAIDRALRIEQQRADLLGTQAAKVVAIYDWQKEVAESGIDPGAFFEQLAQEAYERLKSDD